MFETLQLCMYHYRSFKSVKMMTRVKILQVAAGKKSLRRGQFALKNTREDRSTVSRDRKSPKRCGRHISFDCIKI